MYSISNVKVYVNDRRKFNWFWKRWKIEGGCIEFSESFRRYVCNKQLTFEYMYKPDTGIKEVHFDEYISGGEYQ